MCEAPVTSLIVKQPHAFFPWACPGKRLCVCFLGCVIKVLLVEEVSVLGSRGLESIAKDIWPGENLFSPFALVADSLRPTRGYVLGSQLSAFQALVPQELVTDCPG